MANQTRQFKILIIGTNIQETYFARGGTRLFSLIVLPSRPSKSQILSQLG